MTAIQPRPTTTKKPAEEPFFLLAYRDHLLSELAEVQRRLGVPQDAKAARQDVGFES
jgi:hypothetical protein